jgi:hypothetical protein
VTFSIVVVAYGGFPILWIPLWPPAIKIGNGKSRIYSSGFPIAVFDCQRASHFLYTAYYLKNNTQQSNMMNPIQIFVKGTLVKLLLCIMIFSHFLYHKIWE